MNIFNNENYLAKLDQPTIIPLESLKDYYCPAEEAPAILNELKSKLGTRIDQKTVEWVNTHDIDYYNYFPFGNTMSESIRIFDERFSFLSKGIRTSILTHPDLRDRICKVYEAAPGRAHHMANTLRVPMAHKINSIAHEYSFSLTDAPDKHLFPLYDHSLIMQLNEGVINEAYILLVERRNIIKEFPDELVSKQQEMAEQICAVISLTGLGDSSWGGNIALTSKDGSLLATFLDTEPLYGEMCVDSRKRGLFNRNVMLIENCTLRKCAMTGLETFGATSNYQGLEIFENVSQKFLEVISP